MTRPSHSSDDGAGSGDAHLLWVLLTSEVPSRHGQIRPARLRSAAQQEQIALRGFRLRTWVDRALLALERSLASMALLAFGYWLLDGPIRDGWHTRFLPVAQRAQAITLTPTPSLSEALIPPGSVKPAPLPFTRPDGATPPLSMPHEAFLAPQMAPVALPVNDDPRPQRLIMPSIGADMAVYEVFVIDGEWQVAEYAAGYHHGTALPGAVGNTVISGHAGLRGAVFKDLGRLRPGDDIFVETSNWLYVYRVRGSLKVWPTQIEVMAPTPTPVLTLITCTNWDAQRLVVVADLVDARPRF